MWKSYRDRFEKYIEECAKRHRQEYGHRPSLTNLIDFILIYDRYKTGWLSIPNIEQEVRMSARYYANPDVPLWMR